MQRQGGALQLVKEEHKLTQHMDQDALSTVPGERIIDKPDIPQQGVEQYLEADTENVEGHFHLKVGRYRKFEVYSDEPARIGGEDTFCSPMGYLAMAVGF